VRFSLFLITAEVVTVRDEELGGAATHEMNNSGPYRDTSSVAATAASSLRSEDMNEAIPQVKGMASIWPCCLVQMRIIFSVTGSESRDAPDMNFDQTHDVSDAGASNDSLRLTQAEAQTRACFVEIVEFSIS
jgi:hypothetical protein